MPIKPMTVDELGIVGKRLHGSKHWISKLAPQLGVDVSTVWRWSAGKIAVPSPMAVAIRALDVNYRTSRAMQQALAGKRLRDRS